MSTKNTHLPNALRFERRGRFNAPAEKLWPFLADTPPPLNRAKWLKVEAEEVSLRGINEPVRVYRLTLPVGKAGDSAISRLQLQLISTALRHQLP